MAGKKKKKEQLSLFGSDGAAMAETVDASLVDGCLGRLQHRRLDARLVQTAGITHLLRQEFYL